MVNDSWKCLRPQSSRSSPALRRSRGLNISEPQTRRAGWYKRLFAYMMSQERAEYGDAVAGRKRTLLGNLNGTVLEIGPGTGPTLSFYAPDVHWVGVEPNPAMWPYAQREAKQLGLN